jgi:hypothetical protein
MADGHDFEGIIAVSNNVGMMCNAGSSIRNDLVSVFSIERIRRNTNARDASRSSSSIEVLIVS